MKVLDRESGFGPWTAHVSFKFEHGEMTESVVLGLPSSWEDEASSRYADPDAEDTRPVLRTVIFQYKLSVSFSPFLAQFSF